MLVISQSLTLKTMWPHHRESLSYSSRDFQMIFRINKKTGATERQRYFAGKLPNSLKKEGWKAEVKKGKRLYKTN